MEKKRILSLLLLTSLTASTANISAIWPFSAPQKSFAEKIIDNMFSNMFGGLCSTLQKGEDLITNEVDMFKYNMPNFIRTEAYRTLAGSIAAIILKFGVYKPCAKIANYFSSDPTVSVSKKDLLEFQKKYNEIADENDELKRKLCLIIALLEKQKKNKDNENKKQKKKK